MSARAPAAVAAVALSLALAPPALAQSPAGGGRADCGAPSRGPGSGPDDRVVIAGGATVGSRDTVGDLVVGDGDVRVLGAVRGDAVVFSGDVTIAGCVRGDVTTFTGRATVLPGARVGGDLIYFDHRPRVSPAASVGGEIRKDSFSRFDAFPWAVVGAIALWVSVTLSLLVLGILLVALFPRAADAAREAAASQFGLTVALGLAAVICLLLAGTFSFFTLLGAPLAIVIGLALVPLWVISYLTCCHLLGRAIVKEATHPMLAFLVGFAILRAVALIPVVGALAWIPAGIIGLGALVIAAIPGISGNRPAAS